MATTAQAYSSFSGIDIIAVVDEIPIGTLQGISYSITREKAPIYTMGSANFRSVSRGKRGVAGSMIFTLFNKSAMYDIMNEQDYYYYRKEGEEYSLTSDGSDPWAWSDNITVSDGLQTERVKAEFADQIMPFNVTLIGQNEYGLAAWKAILGIEILNEGGGLSVDDITNEEQMTYIARTTTGWVSWSDNDDENITSGDGNFYTGSGLPTVGETTVKPYSDNVIASYQEYLGLTE